MDGKTDCTTTWTTHNEANAIAVRAGDELHVSNPNIDELQDVDTSMHATQPDAGAPSSP